MIVRENIIGKHVMSAGCLKAESSFELSRHVANQLREDLKSLSEGQGMMAIVWCQARKGGSDAHLDPVDRCADLTKQCRS